jgi:hypothetical protein
MVRSPVSCTACQAALPASSFNRHELRSCPNCGQWLEAEIFPALFKPPPTGQPGETLLVAGESGCFYHPQKRAVVPCDACGRFLCGLCDVDFNGQHLCPVCLETGQKKGRLKNLENHRTLYDSAALTVALAGLLIWPLVVITGPVAIYVAVRYWNTPSSLVRRTKLRAMIAVVVGLAEFVLGGFFWYWLINR